ncbi:MAG: hypothetical protein RBR67_21065 [Desulfobacterium sp.]|nr:hypothetical protein [Desulfobacterium sp.]MDY0374995.1 hypothetical protein [Desulfobacterium sp.]
MAGVYSKPHRSGAAAGQPFIYRSGIRRDSKAAEEQSAGDEFLAFLVPEGYGDR